MMRHDRESPRHALFGALAAGILAAAPIALRAQSNLSTQGFGFPTGQFSTRALGTGGALGEMDPLSPVNPASIGVLGVRTLFFQIEPEYRTVTTAAGSEHTSTARYPVVFGALPIGSNMMVSFGSSTLLDRSSSTSFNTTQGLNAVDSVAMTTTFGINGAMNDVRLAFAWRPASWLQVGVGAHGITGRNLITVTQSFADTVAFAAFTQQRILGFSGAAASAGFSIFAKDFVAAASGRLGGPLSVSAEDTLLGKARVPNRFGASLAYTGFTGTTLAVRTSRDDWSSMGSLGSSNLMPVDAWDTSIGADVAGPKVADHTIYLRAGFRMRTLPFLANTDTVSEKSLSFGTGSSFAGGHVLADLAVIRAWRTAALNASEQAWTLSFGLSIRP